MFDTGIVKPGLAAGDAVVPGLSSMNMSFKPVRGRSSAVAFWWIRCLYFWLICSVTIAMPFSSLTPPISPTCTPETRTD